MIAWFSSMTNGVKSQVDWRSGFQSECRAIGDFLD